MNNIENHKRDELTLFLNDPPANLTQTNASALTVIVIVFLVMMLIPAHIAVAMLFATFTAVSWQLKLMLNGANNRIKELQKLLLKDGQQRQYFVEDHLKR